ncbi:MAG: DUF370 domain-containing protein [Oscillospiraceae bacterium]|nr:DUF370 domain-containing protein [Oscillospiraceae bacterium]
MYIHIGNNKSIRDKDIIGIFDIEASVSDDTREYLAAAGRRNNAVYVSYEETKSFIVSVGEGREKVYITNVGHRTLAERAKNKK